MRSYRSYHDLMAALLEGALEPARISSLMCYVRTSYSRLKGLISTATSLGLLEVDGGRYRTSSRGKEFLEAYKKVRELLGEVEERDALDPELMEEARRMAEAMKDSLKGRSRRGILAASYYIVARRRGLKVSCERLSLLFGVSANTIRNVLKAMREFEA